ncbi:MAG: TIGR02710 family CRISPR-associated protein [Gemmatimonadetes bacterium]|nr:TIGR02710 family CRISPR-associated protein [Gemmatimonadota bacterium]
MSGDYILLVATVGGSPEPLVAALVHWRPARVWFLASADTECVINEKIVPLAEPQGVQLDSGRREILTLPDAQDLRSCIARLRQLTPHVQSWLARGDGHRVVVELTGGTKCMSAALALHAHRWPCTFSYVGGGERTKGGVGVVVGGTEHIFHMHNPWDTLGYQAMEDACALFNRGESAAAAERLRQARDRAEDPAVKRELSTLEALTRAYAAWDCFDHGDAANRLKDVIKNRNDLSVAFGADAGDRLLDQIERHRAHLQCLIENSHIGVALVRDLVANATRRARERRYDDAVARLYRAVEALAQIRLRDGHGIDTSRVSVTQLPQALRTEWADRAEEGTLVIGLQDAYTLLERLGDPLGSHPVQSRLRGPKSPLAIRNQSILAHGFQPVGESGYTELLKATVELGKLSQTDLPTFPRIPEMTALQDLP